MGYRNDECRLAAVCVMLVAGMALILTAETVVAQGQPSDAQIIDALRPGKTRSIRLPNDAKATEEQAFINSLRGQSTRSITIEQRTKLDEIARTRPNIDLEINFEFNSAVVGPQAVPVLVSLGQALSRDEFRGIVFVISGHTDAKGSLEYNQDLSERRAEAVKATLVKQFHLPAPTLIAVGYGKTKLKNTTDPFAGENRRVQIVNTEVK